MPERRELGFRVANFDNLQDGSVSIRSPSVNDILQIGLEKHTHAYQNSKVPLRFEKSGPAILFGRRDPVPVQVEIVGYNAAYAIDDADPEDSLNHKYAVLQEPVDELYFIRGEDGLWRMDGKDVVAVQSERTRKFMHTVALGAHVKQQEAVARTMHATEPRGGVV